MSEAERAAAWTVEDAVTRLSEAMTSADVTGVQVPAGHSYIGGLGWFRVWQRGQRVGAPPAGLSADALSRRRFAERLADTLAYPGEDVARYGHGGDLFGASSEYVPVAASPVAQRVIADAERVAEHVAAVDGETRVYDTGQGAVVLVHGPDWSLLFEHDVVGVTIRVCGDEWDEIALAVDEDPDPQVQSQLLTMVYDVLFQLQRVSVGGDRFAGAVSGDR